MEETGSIRRIVLGLDGSRGSMAATRWCARLAHATGAKVWAVHGVGRFPEVMRGGAYSVAAGLGMAGPGPHSWTRQERVSLQRWCAPLREAGVGFEAELVDDDAVSALLGVAARVEADLIVVGVQDRRGVSRLLGSVPYKLSHHSHVPVVLVPGTRSTGEDPEQVRPAPDQSRPAGWVRATQTDLGSALRPV